MSKHPHQTSRTETNVSDPITTPDPT